MMVMVVMMVVSPGSERRAGEHQQHQDSEKSLFHGPNVARGLPRRKGFELPRIN
jgi:hypothetical protein